MPDHDDRASAIFLALASVAPADRPARLREACAGDEDLQAVVEQLLAGLDEGAGPLDTPPAPGIVDAPTELAMGTPVGDFTLLDILGSGGAGIVYRALQRRPLRAVALKLLRQGIASTSVRKRFEVEAEILGRLHHPGIAQVFAAHPGDASAPAYIALELVDGPSLTDYADQHRLSTRQRVELVALVCDAVQHAHQRGVIHRDLKPANILVTSAGQPKVLDFGVARALGGSLAHSTIETEEGQLMGTVPFMSPEQVDATPDMVDTRTDVYAIGVILFRLLTGRVPFADDDPPLPELARRIAHVEPPRLAAIDASLAGDLDTIVARALAKDRDRRYPSAADLAGDLRRHLAGEPIAAVADSAWYLLRRRVVRYRTAFVASLAALVALGGLLAYATVLQRRADEANLRLQRELASSTIERGRLLAQGGNHLLAEALVWPELFRAPGSRHALWTLAEIYSRQPALWARVGHEGGTNTVRFSRDGRLVLSAGNDGRVRLLDQATGRDIRTFEGHRGRVIGAVFGRDDRRILSYGEDATVRIWDAASGRVERAETFGRRPIQSAMAVPGDEAFVICDDEGRVEYWRLEPALSRRRLADPSGVACRVVAPHPDQPRVAAGFDRGLLRAWDLDTGTMVVDTIANDGGSLTALAYSPDGRVLVAGGADQVLRMLDPASARQRRVLRPENGTVRRVSFDASGRWLVVVGWWRTRVLDLASDDAASRDIGVGEGAWDARITPDGRWLVTCEEVVGRVRMWELGATPIERTWQAHDARVSGLAVAAGTPGLTTGSHDGRVRSWRDDGTLDAERTSGQRVNALAASPDGRWMVAGGDAGALAWSPATGRSYPVPVGEVVTALAFTGDGLLVVGNDAGDLAAFRFGAEGPQRAWEAPNLGGEILGLAVSGRHLAVCYRDRNVAIHDLATGQAIRRFEPTMTAFSLAFNGDGTRLVVGTWGGTIYVFDVATGRRLHVLDGHSRLVGGLAIPSSNDLVLSASRDGTTRAWDLDTGLPLAVLARRGPGAERVRVLPGVPLKVAIGYDDGVVDVVDVEHFLRHVAGNVEYSRRLYASDPARFPRADEVVSWSRRQAASPAPPSRSAPALPK